MNRLPVIETKSIYTDIVERSMPAPTMSQTLSVFENLQPEIVTILPTYRCTAACRECCFESNPSIKHVMNQNDLMKMIERIHKELPQVKLVVLSGGEVTLLNDNLIKAITLLKSYNIQTRIVSNGHWGLTDKSAKEWVTKLISAGLNELNLSTGDEHQEWVPIDSVARAAYHAVKQGLLTVISNEGSDNSVFRQKDLRSNPYISKILGSPELRKLLILIQNIWMPFHDNTNVSNDKSCKQEKKGCDNIFQNFVINPYGYLMSCCGLTMEYIPEMKVGNVSEGEDLHKVYSKQFENILKLWIWLDGTKYIFERAVEHANLQKSIISPHMCSICAQIYKDPEIRRAVIDLVRQNEEDIVFRATIKAQFRQMRCE